VGSLVIEASLHETTDPRDPADPKHHVLGSFDLLDAVEWVPVGPLYEVRGGPVGAPLRVPDSFPGARAALCERFPAARGGVDALLSADRPRIDPHSSAPFDTQEIGALRQGGPAVEGCSTSTSPRHRPLPGAP
jgi:hypothetical protein